MMSNLKFLLAACFALSFLASPSFAQTANAPEATSGSVSDVSSTTSASEASTAVSETEADEPIQAEQNETVDLVRQDQGSIQLAPPSDEARGERSPLLQAVGDSISFTMGGEFDLGFHFGENFDLNPDGFHSLNYVASQLMVSPTIWISEAVRFHVEMNLLPDVVWDGQRSWDPLVVQGYAEFSTLVGTFRLGRQLRDFGLGIAYSSLRNDEVPFGLPRQLLDTEDRVDWQIDLSTGDASIQAILGISWLEDPFAQGVLSKSDLLRYSIQAGADWQDGSYGVEAFYALDRQKSEDHLVHNLSLHGYTDLGSKLHLATELGLLRGETDRIQAPSDTPGQLTSLQGYRAAVDVSLQNTVTKKGVSFSGTKLRGLLATGPRRNNILFDDTLNYSATTRTACGCLIASQFVIDTLRQSREAAAILAAQRARLAGSAVPSDTALRDAYAQLGQMDGYWMASFIGVLEYKDFLTQLGVFHLRATEPYDKLTPLNDTTALHSRELGTEIDLKFQYTAKGLIQVGLDAGLFVGGDIFESPDANNGITNNNLAYMLQPFVKVKF